MNTPHDDQMLALAAQSHRLDPHDDIDRRRLCLDAALVSTTADGQQPAPWIDVLTAAEAYNRWIESGLILHPPPADG